MSAKRDPRVEAAAASSMNELARQAQQGVLNPAAVVAPLLDVENAADPAVNLGEYLRSLKEIPPEPTGPGIRGCARLTEATGGIVGMWVVGGQPGVGKSTFALHTALGVAEQGMSVVYLDAENGKDALVRHAYLALGGKTGDRKRLERLLDRITYVPKAGGLDAALAKVPAPALLVVDSLQKLPTPTDQRRTGLDAWLRRLEIAKKDQGYAVLALSEMPRSTYHDQPGRKDKFGAWIGAFAETREIEYTADIAIQMISGDELEGEVDVYLVKNRNRPAKGYVATLRRTNGWSWVETEGE